MISGDNGMRIEELDHLVSLSPGEGVKRHADEQAIGDRIIEWLETPEGTVADMPSWGHILRPFKHEPAGTNLAVIIEMAIVEKMPKDIRDLVIGGIRVDFDEMDMARVSILYHLGLLERTIDLMGRRV